MIPFNGAERILQVAGLNRQESLVSWSGGAPLPSQQVWGLSAGRFLAPARAADALMRRFKDRLYFCWGSGC